MSDEIKQHVSGLASVGREVQGIGAGTREYWVVFWRGIGGDHWVPGCRAWEDSNTASAAALELKESDDLTDVRIVRVELPV